MMDPKKKFNKWREEQEMIYPNPACEYCNQYERMRDKLRVILLIANILIGGMLIYYTRNGIESDCCRAYKEISTYLSEISGGDVAYIEPKDYLSMKNEMYDNFGGSNFTVRMPQR